jgi:hypothetical protein
MKYPSKETYLIQLENETLRERVKSLKERIKELELLVDAKSKTKTENAPGTNPRGTKNN